jgi:cyclopropane-fatty-acyl-phospholipid synthase
MAISDVVQSLSHPIIFRGLDEVLADYPDKNFQVRLWDGATWGESANPRFTLVLSEPEALRTLFDSPSELSVGEAYIAGHFDVEGDMQAAFALGDYLLSHGRSGQMLRVLLALLRKKPADDNSGVQGNHVHGSVHSRQRDRLAIRYHYDLPPDFFSLWLDPRMIYSCAYFADANLDDLEAAQNTKLEYICRKLRLRPGEHLLDIGCGWGGLITYAAARHGVQALGVTLSLRQAEVARKRIRDAGLESRCRVELCDYRDIESAQQFDKIVSVGMFEHVGLDLLPGYFQRAWEMLREGGSFLNSGIASAPRHHGEPKSSSFIDHYVFPDGELAPLSSCLAAAEAAGFEVRDVENLREHYALTLHQWVRRLEANSEEARRITDEATYRIWRLYMAGSEHWFRTAALNLYHVLFAKPDHGQSYMPLTRSDWYS